MDMEFLYGQTAPSMKAIGKMINKMEKANLLTFMETSFMVIEKL
jgi:hypothetical protein